MRLLSGMIVAAVLAAGPALAQTHDAGPAIGATLPAIQAPDQTGAARTMLALSGERGLILLVTRAADGAPIASAR